MDDLTLLARVSLALKYVRDQVSIMPMNILPHAWSLLAKFEKMHALHGCTGTSLFLASRSCIWKTILLSDFTLTRDGDL